jgi:diaminopimelate decarboxylase
LTPVVSRLLADPRIVEDAVAQYGSPLHLIFPQVFADNIDRFRAALDKHRLSYRICYAHKANQAAAFVVAAQSRGIGIDVASAGELAGALAAGFTPDRIEATGPKGVALLRELVAAGVTINVDNLWELGQICSLAEVGAAVPVLLRLSGFDPDRPAGRFGIDLADAPAALTRAAAAGTRIELRGVSFHLDSGDGGERLDALACCLRVFEQAYRLGLRPGVVDIGGGFRQAFSADPAAFQRYVKALVDGLNGDGPALAWPGHTFGFRARGGRYGGVPSFHKYGNDIGGTALVDELLTARLDGRPAAAALRDALLELWLEPGKALLDHAGITVATVEFTKQLRDGGTVVNLDISRDTITPADQEVMLDPIVGYRGAPAEYGGPAGVFFAGRLCLENDLVSRHLVELPRLPRPGDRVVFVNTAAYQMDLSAAAALLHPLPRKIVVTEHEGRFVLAADRAPGGDGTCCTGTSPN